MRCAAFIANFKLFIISSTVLLRGTNSAPLPDPDSAEHSLTENANEESIKYRAQAFLFRYGYLSGKSKNSLSSSTSSELKEALKRLQTFAGLEVTGTIDSNTMSLMDMPRCQLPDTAAVRGLKKRFVSGGKWDSNVLTYDVLSYPTKSFNLGNSTNVDDILETSFKDWADVSNLFIKRSSSSPKITVNFYSRDHGDGYPFDGNGRVLGHAFFPPYGQVHFDNDERWSSASFGGPNLKQVSTHEIGHVLGLDHTNVREAVMFPYYAYSYNFKLHEDDVKGITSIYGPRKSNSAPSLLNNLLPSSSTTTSPQTTASPITTTSTTTTFQPTTSISIPSTTTSLTTPTESTQLRSRKVEPTTIGFIYWWQWRQNQSGTEG